MPQYPKSTTKIFKPKPLNCSSLPHIVLLYQFESEPSFLTNEEAQLISCFVVYVLHTQNISFLIHSWPFQEIPAFLFQTFLYLIEASGLP